LPIFAFSLFFQFLFIAFEQKPCTVFKGIANSEGSRSSCHDQPSNYSPRLSAIYVSLCCQSTLMKEKFLEWLNLALVANLFLVLFSFFWLAVAVTGRAFGVSLGLDLWYRLWEPVFTPAIGILMAGALLSGLLGWLRQRFDRQSL
jgi:hypothetical protein